MKNDSAKISALRQRIREETYKALGMTRSRFLRILAHPLIALPTHRFAAVGTHFDHQVAISNFCEAARRILPTFISKLAIVGQENIPTEGPLLITSNHPGISDALVIAASIPRDDLRIVVGDIPFLKGMPNTSRYLFYANKDTPSRTAVVRATIRHLLSGGAVLIFASGHLDPDPACIPGADAALNDWSRSLEIMLRKAPHTKLLPTIVRGVLRKDFATNPLVLAGHTMRDKQRIAEFVQVMWQLLLPHCNLATPQISFGAPVQLESLNGQGRVIDSIIARARQLLHAKPNGQRINMQVYPTKN